jgi:hypothetical protein
MEVSGQLKAPAALPPGNSPRYPLTRRLGGHQGRSGRWTWTARNQTRAVQPVACRYIDRVILTPNKESRLKILIPYSVTPWMKIFLEEYRKFIAVFTWSWRLTVSWIRLIQSTPSRTVHLISIWISSPNLCPGPKNCPFLQVFRLNLCVDFSSIPSVLYIMPI